MKIIHTFLVMIISVMICHAAETPTLVNQSPDMKAELIEQFKQNAVSGELSQLLADNATVNIDFPTFGGKVWWETYEAGDWKLQFNTISGWWRILDADDVRVARGVTAEQLSSLLANRPTSVIANYFDDGCRFSYTPAKRGTGRTVVIIHGWGVRARSMQELAYALADHGFDCYNYDYPTAQSRLEEHCNIFLAQFRKLVAALPPEEELFFLTHSMGGLILRGAMAQMSEAECRRISAIVMLGPPNRGSVLAYIGELPGVEYINASLQDMSPDDDSFVSQNPAPTWLPPVSIIAGRYDGKVAIENTRLPEPLPYKHTVVPCTHPGLRNPDNVLELILEFYSAQPQ